MQAFIERFRGTAVETDQRTVDDAAAAGQALDALDGREVTSVTFERGKGPVLMVSGGPGAYLASLWDEDAGEGWTAQEADDTDAREVEVVSAGQAVAVPAYRILTKAKAGEIVASYVAGHDKSDAVAWVAD